MRQLHIHNQSSWFRGLTGKQQLVGVGFSGSGGQRQDQRLLGGGFGQLSVYGGPQLVLIFRDLTGVPSKKRLRLSVDG